jgi:hypothetical protein
VAGTHGSVDERAGAAYVLGTDPDPTMFFFARVGGPLASARAEAASLLQLLQDVRRSYGYHVHLLIFVVCLIVLDILRKWGRSDFRPNSKEIIYFTGVHPLVHELRQSAWNITLPKVKGHTGCLLNELAKLGRTTDGPESAQAHRSMVPSGCAYGRKPDVLRKNLAAVAQRQCPQTKSPREGSCVQRPACRLEAQHNPCD